MAARRSLVAAAALLVVFTAQGLAAQVTPRDPEALTRALDLEGAGKCREAVVLYRQALAEGSEPAGPLLGLERCYMQLGEPAPLLEVLDSVLSRRPRDPVARVAYLRTLASSQRHEEADLAFRQWVNAAPREAAPFREYARILLDQGRTRAADTVLQQATMSLGSPREVAAEMAELRGALGMWEASAQSWREALAVYPYLEAAAVWVLTQATPAARDSVRAVLLAAPLELPSRRILAGLEMRWRSPREAWAVLSAVPPSDSAVQSWVQFASDAEQADAWLVARDAYALALKRGADPALAFRAARAAMEGGEAESALSFLAAVEATSDSAGAATTLLLRIRALSQLGRTADAESLLSANAARLDPVTRGDAVRAVAWGWVRVGDLEKARAALARGGEADERVAAWMALYEGDIKAARAGLRRLDETSRDAVLALALLARTRTERAPQIGAGFLALARRDTSAAARSFEAAAAEVPDAAPLLLAVAARLYAVTADSQRTVPLWQQVLERHPESPEAAEVELDWARALRHRGDTAGAIARLEHMILTYPQSALVPQARRELEIARGAIPPLS